MFSLFLDLETFSSVDLAKCGVYRYTEAPDFEIQLLSYSINGGEVYTIDLANGEEIAVWLRNEILSENNHKHSHNAMFERICLSKYFGLPTGKYLDPRNWYCDMVHGAYLGLPLKLADLGAVLGVDKQKMSEGKRLVQKFSKPDRKGIKPLTQGEVWERYKAYNKRDVETEMEIAKKMSRFPVPDFVCNEYWADCRLNDLGILVDTELAKRAVEFDERSSGGVKELMKYLTGLENPNSVAQLKKWLADNGCEVDSLGKADVLDLLENCEKGSLVEKVLLLRQQASMSSVKKYSAMLSCVSKDNRARGLFQFYGSHTGRESGRRIQLQNLPRGTLHDDDLVSARDMVKSGDYDGIEVVYGGVSNVLSSLCRSALIPKDGHKFVASDYSAVENRTLAWLADEQKVLDVFIRGDDVYKYTASGMLKIPYSEITKDQRQKGKVATLACLAEGTLVLTDKGLKRIEDTQLTDRLWDGIEWVSHIGVVDQGLRAVKEVDGIVCTPDHLLMTKKGWCESGKIKGFDWFKVSAPAVFDKLKFLYQDSGEVKSTEPMRRTYDILNAGKRHCFAVWNGRELILSHNCGYGGGIGAMKAFGADKMGLSDEDIQRLVTDYRQANPNIVRYWYALENACKRAIKRGTMEELPHGVFVYVKGGAMILRLPSGRELFYQKVGLCENRFGGESIEFYGVGLNKKWGKQETYGGKLVENCLSGETIVVTNTGYKKLNAITKTDLLWDGFEWVSHGGLIAKGEQKTMSVHGVHMTPDHRILTLKGWKRANEYNIKYRFVPRYVEGYNPDKAVVRQAKFYEQVYDIVNCGKRNCFTIMCDDGLPMVVHNCTQAVARDLMYNSILELQKAGFDVVLQCHDEAVAEVPIGTSAELINKIMATVPKWAKGLPLKAEGEILDFYKK